MGVRVSRDAECRQTILLLLLLLLILAYSSNLLRSSCDSMGHSTGHHLRSVLGHCGNPILETQQGGREGAHSVNNTVLKWLTTPPSLPSHNNRIQKVDAYGTIP